MVRSAPIAAAPSLPAPFRWEDGTIRADLEHGHVMFTARPGGVSCGPWAGLNLGDHVGDRARDVLENRGRVAGMIGVSPDRLIHGHQVHGTRVRRVTDDTPEATQAEPSAPRPGAGTSGAPAGTDADAAQGEADGQATTLAGRPVMVLAADCVPVLLVCDGAVAAVHAGWRGLAAGILAEGVRAIRDLGAAGPITAAIGPAIGPCCYEAGEEVHAAVDPDGRHRHGARRLHLAGVAGDRLPEAGAAAVHDVGLCTACADPGLLFSYRRDGGTTGRQAGLAWR